MSSFPALTIVLFLPLLGVAGALALPRQWAWGWALLCALADLALAIALFVAFDAGLSGFQFHEAQPWIPGFGITYALGLDGVSLMLVGLNALLTVVAVAASFGLVRTSERPRQYLALLLLLATGMQGVFLATNLFLFYVFWELMLVPAYLLVGIYGGPRRTYAAIKFVIYTAAGSLLMLVGVIATGAVASASTGRPYSLDLGELVAAAAKMPVSAQVPLFLAFFAAFAVKSGLFPLHSWAPDTYSEAPVPVVVLIAGVMAKTGTYGFLRFTLPLFPQGAHLLQPLMIVLSVVGILYFALMALVQTDFLRLLAYVSLSHMGVIVLAVFAFNAQGLEGAVLQMVNHGIVIAALFLIAGWIAARAGTRDLTRFGGLAARWPWLATVFLIAALSALGLPGLNSFAGEFLAFLGAFRANLVAGILATAVVIPAAWYMLRFFQNTTEGSLVTAGPVAAAVAKRRAGAASGDLRVGEALVLLPLILLIFYLGVQPAILTTRMETTVTGILTAANARTAAAIPLTRGEANRGTTEVFTMRTQRTQRTQRDGPHPQPPVGDPSPQWGTPTPLPRGEGSRLEWW